MTVFSRSWHGSNKVGHHNSNDSPISYICDAFVMNDGDEISNLLNEDHLTLCFIYATFHGFDDDLVS